MLQQLTLKNFTVFNDVSLTFSPHLNVIVGENGKGKSHLLKVAYSMMSIDNNSITSKSQISIPGSKVDTATNLRR